MKLHELNASLHCVGGFVAEGEYKKTFTGIGEERPHRPRMKRVLPKVSTVAEADLVMMDCPGCKRDGVEPHQLKIFFAGKNRDAGNEKQWDAWGRTIDDLTLAPEIQWYVCGTQFWVRGGGVVLSGKTGMDWVHDI